MLLGVAAADSRFKNLNEPALSEDDEEDEGDKPAGKGAWPTYRGVKAAGAASVSLDVERDNPPQLCRGVSE